MRLGVWVTLAALLAATAMADEVVLKTGDVVTGDIVVRMADAVVVKTPDGRVVRYATDAIQEIRTAAKADAKAPPTLPVKPLLVGPLDPATPIVVRKTGPAIIGSLGAQMGDTLILRKGPA